MEIRKVRGKNKVNVFIDQGEMRLAERLGVPVKDWVEVAVKNASKKRKWKLEKSSIEDKEGMR